MHETAQFLWTYYGYLLVWVQMLASYQDGQFFFPMATAARKSSCYFQSCSVYYGIDAGLAVFKERMRLAKLLSKCTKHQIFILTIKQAVSSALVDTGEIKRGLIICQIWGAKLKFLAQKARFSVKKPVSRSKSVV